MYVGWSQIKTAKTRIGWQNQMHSEEEHWPLVSAVSGKDERQEQAGASPAGNHQGLSDARGWEDQGSAAGVAAHHSQALGSLTQELHAGRHCQRATRGPAWTWAISWDRRNNTIPLGFPNLREKRGERQMAGVYGVGEGTGPEVRELSASWVSLATTSSLMH